MTEELMTSAYEKFRAYDGPWSERYSDPSLTNREKVTTILGNFHYQVENGGTVQWWDNNFANIEGPDGRTVAEALLAIISQHVDADPEVAKVMMTLAGFGAADGDPRALPAYLAGDAGEEDFEGLAQENFWSGAIPYEKAFGEFGQERRLAFVEAVVVAWKEDMDPFSCPMPAHSLHPAAGDGPRYPHVEVDLVGQDGNAFGLISTTRRALERAGVAADEVKAFTEEAKSGTYDDVLTTISRWVKTEMSSAPAPRPF